jgi:hypothetical protein
VLVMKTKENHDFLGAIGFVINVACILLRHCLHKHLNNPTLQSDRYWVFLSSDAYRSLEDYLLYT